MGSMKTRLLIAVGVAALVVGLCLAPSAASTTEAREGAPAGEAARDFNVFYLDPYPAGAGAVSEAVAATPVEKPTDPAVFATVPSAPDPAVSAPAPEVGEPAPAEGEEPEEAVDDPTGDPRVSAVNPDRPSPSNLNAEYNFGWGIWTRVILSWDGVSDPGFRRYYVLRWTGADYGAMHTIFYDLAALEPAALSYVQDFEYQAQLLGQPGWTDAERKAILEDAEADLDALNYYIATTPGAEELLNQYAALADIAQTTNTNYTDWDIDYDDYYMYAVAAAYAGGDTSLLSNEELIYSVYIDGDPLASPNGFSATAYDPGVALSWERNTEDDLAGYNVYLVEGGTPYRLNSELIEFGTEFFHDTGVEGAVYRVEAVDLWGAASATAEAVSVLAPATVYEEDDPAWQYAGLWVKENYIESGGDVIMVADGAGSTASVAFTGRRIKLYVSSYWQCGDARLWVDGVEYGTCSLYSPDITWDVDVFTVTGLEEGGHTLTVEVLGVGGPEGYNFVNVDFAEAR